MVLGAALRLHTLGAESLWLDEACSIEAAQKSLAGIVEYTADDVHPPLYYWVLHYWIQVAGRSEFALRLLSVVFSLLTIGLASRLAARLFGPGTALVAAVLLALSPFHLAAAQEARMYAMLACLSVWSLSTLVRLLDDRAPSSGTVIACALATAMMLYTHAYGFFTFGAQILLVSAAAIFQSRGSEARWKAAALAQALAFVLFLPWLPVFFVQVFHVQDSFWIPPMPAAELGRALIAFAGGPMAVVLLPLALFAVVKDRGSRWTWFLLIWTAAPVLVPFAVSVVSSPIFLTKYSIAGSVALLLLAARGVTLLPSWRWSAAAVVAAAALAAAPILDDYRTVSKDDWRGAVPKLEALAQPGDLVLFDQSFGRVVVRLLLEAGRPDRGTVRAISTRTDVAHARRCDGGLGPSLRSGLAGRLELGPRRAANARTVSHHVRPLDASAGPRREQLSIAKKR